ncbi:MAG: hypothetical protein V8T34_03515 [Ruminococcus callidus]
MLSWQAAGLTEGFFRTTLYSSQPVSQRVTLLFFFTEKKKRSKKRKEFAFPLYYAATHHPKIIQKIFTNKTPPAGHTGGLSAVTLPFSHLKLGRKVSGGLLSLSKSAVAISAGRRADSPQKSSRFPCTTRQRITRSAAILYKWK